MNDDHLFNAAFEANEELTALHAQLAAAQARVAELESVVAWARRAYKFLNTYMTGGPVSDLLGDAPPQVRP